MSPDRPPTETQDRPGCLGAWIALLSQKKLPEDSIPFRVSVAVTVLIAIVASLHQMEWPGYGWIVLALTVGGNVFSWFRRRENNWVLKVLLSLLMLVVLGNFLFGLAATPYDPRLPLAELLLWLQTMHSFDVPARRDLNYSLMVGLILISLGAVLSSGFSFAFYLVAFLGSALVSMHYHYISEISEGREGTTVEMGRPAGLVGLLGLAGRTALALLVAGAFFYALIPRYESLRLRALPVSWDMRLRLPKVGRGEVMNRSYGAEMTRGRPGQFSFSSEDYFGFNPLVDLSLRGSLSRTVVMQVRSNQWSYYRGLAFTDYDGWFWSLPEEDPRKITSDTPPITLPLDMDISGTQQIVQIFHVERELPNVVFAPFQPYQMFFPSDELYVDQSLGIRAPFPLEEGMVYSVIGVTERRTAGGLKKLPPVERFPRLARSPSVRLPESVPARVRDLAARIAGGYRSPYEKALALTLHLQNNYEYESPPPPYPLDAEVSDYFLFESRKGHCEQFATALVVLARAAGLPARYVTGYLPGTYNPLTGFYEVRGSDAHAWAEVFLPGHGWMSFDPTPTGNGSPTPMLEERGQRRWLLGALLAYLKSQVPEEWTASFREAWKSARDDLAGVVEGVRQMGFPAPAAVALLLLIPVQVPMWLGVLALWRARRTKRWNPLTRALDRVVRALVALVPESPRSPREHIVATYRGMLRVLAGEGLHRRDPQTPREFARQVEGDRAWPEVGELTERFERARYGNGNPGEEDRLEVARLLERLKERLRQN